MLVRLSERLLLRAARNGRLSGMSGRLSRFASLRRSVVCGAKGNKKADRVDGGPGVDRCRTGRGTDPADVNCER